MLEQNIKIQIMNKIINLIMKPHLNWMYNNFFKITIAIIIINHKKLLKINQIITQK